MKEERKYGDEKQSTAFVSSRFYLKRHVIGVANFLIRKGASKDRMMDNHSTRAPVLVLVRCRSSSIKCFPDLTNYSSPRNPTFSGTAEPGGI